MKKEKKRCIIEGNKSLNQNKNLKVLTAIWCLMTEQEKESFEFKPVKLRLKKINLMSYPVRAEGLVKKKMGSARGVMVIVVGNGHGDTSSNSWRDWLHFT